MSTNNFENAKNGIFMIEEYEPLPYEEWLSDMGYEDTEDKKDEYNLIAEDEDNLDIAIDNTMSNIIYGLKDKGYPVKVVSPYEFVVSGEEGDIRLRVKSGYYANAQIIITTQRDELLAETNSEEGDIIANVYDFVDEQGYSEYTEDEEDFEDDPEYHLNEVLHNQVTDRFGNYVEVPDDMLEDDKAVIAIVSEYTTPLKRVANFSNGEALYEKA